MCSLSTVRAATCRVDVKGRHLGSAFWVDDRLLLTADHVVREAERDTFTLNTHDGARITAHVSDQIGGADLAMLQADERPSGVESLSVSADVPEIGCEVVWTGYARLIGEGQLNRQRFGWGPIASTSYANDGGRFFEVDGLFNPGHSGGPVIDQASEKVVGVVSESAGNFEKKLELWDDRVHRLENMFTLTSEISGSQKTSFLEYDSIEDAVLEKDILEDFGLSVELAKQGDDVFLRFDVLEASVLASKVQAEMMRSLLDIALKSFQMGFGVASGGQPLSEFVQRLT